MPLSVGELVGYLRLEGGAQFDRGLASARGEMSGAAQSAQRMAGAMGKAEANLARAGRQSNVAAEGSARLRAANLSLLATTERYNALLGDENTSLRQLALAEAAVIRANEGVRASTPAATIRETTAEAEKSSGVMARTAGTMAAAAKSAIGLGAAFGAFELVKHAIDSGKEFTDALNGVQAVSRASAGQMKAVRAEALGLGKDLTVPGATAIDAADAILELVKAGIKLPRALDAARPALLLASATQTDMADTARVLGDTMDIWSVKGAGASHTAKILGSAALGASHDLVGLFDALKQAGPSARALNIGLDDTATALVFLAKHGLSTGLGGTGLKVLFSTLSKDTPAGTKALQDLGVTAFDTQGKFEGFPKLFDQLHGAQGRFGDDSHRFLHDLNAAFGSRAQNVASLFATSTGKDFDDLRKRLESGNLQKFADTMNRGVGASFRQLQKETTAAGLDAYAGAAPALTSLLQLIGKGVPAAVALAKAALTPFGTAWHAISAGAGPVAHFLGDVLGLLHPVAPVLEATTAAVVSMFLAFKGYQAARGALFAIQDGAALLGVKMRNAAAEYSASFGAMASESASASAALQADLAAVGAAATEEAAAEARAAARVATANADKVASSKAATDAQVTAAEEQAAAANLAATAATESAAETAASAEAASAAVVTAGDEAAIGWAGVAGPIGLAAVGVLSIISLFHHSSTASKEATDAAKAYSDALSTGGKSQLFDTVIAQLKNNGLTGQLKTINDALGHTAFTGGQFVTAIASSGKPLDDLRARLQAVIKAGTSTPAASGAARSITVITPAARAATAALKSLNVQQAALTGEAAKELVNAKSFGVVAGAVGKTATATKLGTQAAQQYAVMAGLQVDKNGVVAKSQAIVDAAVKGVSDAYDVATASGNDYLTALNSFSKSGGTAADRAAMIGATLKAANGDALGFASAMNAGATATTQLGTDVASAAKGVGKSGVSVRSFIKSIVDLKNGSIDYKKSAAAPLITDLQGMQTAAMGAASAMFQHERATKGAGVASDDAYNTFQRLTSGALVGQAKQLGLTKGEADKLATRYFGMPKDVKTAIEAEGTDPIVTVLNKIGTLLANLTGQQWNTDINLHGHLDNAAKTILALGKDKSRVTSKLDSPTFAQASGTSAVFGRSTIPPNTRFTVGEGHPNTWEGGETDAQGRTSIYSNSQSKAMGFKAPMAYASGTGDNYSAIASLLASMGATKAGIAGFLGNTRIESGGSLNPSPGPAHGLQQWQFGRFGELKALAARMGKSWTSQAVQLAMIHRELSGGYKSTLNTLRHATSARSAAAFVDQHYEVSDGSARGRRESAAALFYSQLKSGKISAAADGGPITTGKTDGKKVWIYNGQQYASERAAENARAKAAQGPSTSTELSILSQLAKLGPAKNAASFASNLTGLEQKLTKAGFGKFVKSLAGENKTLLAEAKNRDKAAAVLTAATQKVTDANKARTDDYNSFRSTVLSVYDITSAGQDADGKVTGGGLMASETQELAKIRAWSTGMKRLIGMKIFPNTYLRSLLGKGPEGLTTVQALLSLSGSQMASFANTEKSIEALASGPSSVALLGAKRLDDPAIAAARAGEASAAANVAKYQKALNTELNGFLHKLEGQLGDMHAKLDLKRGDLVLATGTDSKRTRKRKPTKR